MSNWFHGKEVLQPSDFIDAFSEIDLDRIAFGLHYFPETSFADFFACDKDELITLNSPDDMLQFLGYSGFAAFPFQNGSTGYIIPPVLDINSCCTRRFEVKGFYKEEYPEEEPALNHLEFDSGEDYKRKVKDALKMIDSNAFEKVVLCRSIRKSLTRKQLNPFIRKIFEQHRDANLMLFNIPGKGFWISASPEVLLTYGYSMLGAAESSILSHALAGTKPADSSLPWAEKEIREQKLVSNFIEEKFLAYANSGQIQKWGPGEQVAGKLRHLLTLFHLKGGSPETAIRLLNSLHPTPAVCGFPYQDSYGWLLENECLDRSFFSGFSGSFHPERMKFIVNLRTACFRDNNLVFFAGAGIVKDSDPEAELLETEHKIDTLLSLL
jgi:isochorismate synthase